MNRSKKSVYNAAFGLANQLIVLLVGLIIPRLFILSYGSEMNGLQSSIGYIYTYIALLEAGIGTATIQALFGPLARGERDRVNSVLAATNLQYRKVAKIYFLCMLIFAAVYPFTIQTSINRLTIAGMILLSGVSSLMSFWFYGKFVLLLQADGCSFVVMTAGLVAYLMKNVIKIVFITMGAPILIVYLGEAFIPLITYLIYATYRKKHYAWIDYSAKPDLQAISQSKNVLVHQISSIVCNSTDVMVLTYVVGDLKLVSIYNLYTMIFDAVKSIIQNVFSSVNFIMGQTYNSDIETYRKYHKIYEISDFTVSFILYSVAYVMILPFMSVYTAGITDVNYLDPKLPLLFVGIKLLTSVREPASQLINYAGHFKKTQNRSMIEAGLNLVGSIFLASKMGIYGILLATVISLLYRTVDMYFYTSRQFLNRSVWYSFAQWALYMTAFAGVIWARSQITLSVTGYVSFFLNAIVVGLCLTAYYVCITCVFHPKLSAQMARGVAAKLKKKGRG